MKLVLLASGNGSLAQALIDARFDIAGLVTDNPSSQVIERAKEIRKVSDGAKDVQLIKKDIEDINKNVDEYMKDASKAIRNNIEDSIQQVIESIEQEVLKKNKIDVSDDDL